MTLPLRKEKHEGSPMTSMDPSPKTTQESEIEREQERPRLLRTDPNTAPGNTAGSNLQTPAATEIAAENTPLFPSNELQDFQGRWDRIQTAFVDQPRQAVGDADSLVSSAVQRLSETFAAERSRLEKQWDGGDNVSTEDLRVALQRYRLFFRRMLSV